MTSETLDVGPALDEVRAAQRADDEVAQHPQLESYGDALAKLCQNLGYPTVWAVGPAAERLVGAAVILSRGKVHARGWKTDITGQRVLLITASAVMPLPLLAAARHARSLGAAEVYSCGVRARGLGPDEMSEILNAYIPLTAEQAERSPEA